MNRFLTEEEVEYIKKLHKQANPNRRVPDEILRGRSFVSGPERYDISCKHYLSDDGIYSLEVGTIEEFHCNRFDKYCFKDADLALVDIIEGYKLDIIMKNTWFLSPELRKHLIRRAEKAGILK